ncbi:MAG: hypothetical protein NTV67_05270 [Chloroflexi bacterium]|nr:hypothetical protein [Chloroflexota bacterium]
MPESERSGASFSESIDQLIGAIRALLLGHWSLLRAELGAIARDVVITLIGAAAIVSLIVTALLGLLIALFLTLGEGLFGSQLWGAAQMTLLLLSLAAAIASSILRIETGRRRRALLLGALAGVGALLLTLLPLAWAPGPAVGLALTLLLAVVLVDLLLGLRTFETQRFTDRFMPLASEAELRATAQALEDLREEALGGVAAEVGEAIGSADAAIGTLRRSITRVAETLTRAAERIRPDRGGDA